MNCRFRISKEQSFDHRYKGDVLSQRIGRNTGLGLMISKALVETRGGTITADSPGIAQGNTFTITIAL